MGKCRRGSALLLSLLATSCQGDGDSPQSQTPKLEDGYVRIESFSKAEDTWVNPDLGVTWFIAHAVKDDKVLFDGEKQETRLEFSGSLAERNDKGTLSVSGYKGADYCSPGSYLFVRENLGVSQPGQDWEWGGFRIFAKLNGGSVEVGRFRDPNPTMTEYEKMMLASWPILCEGEYSKTCSLVTKVLGTQGEPLGRNRQAEVRLLVGDQSPLWARTVKGMNEENCK